MQFPKEPIMDELRKAIAEKDYETAKNASHTLKGNALNLGFIDLAGACTDMHVAFKAGKVEEALSYTDEVEEEYTKMVDAILKCL